MASFANLIGRLLLSAIFVISGVFKIVGFSATADAMAAKGMFAVPVFLVATIIIEVFGGLGVAFGFKARICALVLALFLIPVTLVFHDFWNLSGSSAQQEMGHFMSNLAIMGALWMIVARGPGPMSVEK